MNHIKLVDRINKSSSWEQYAKVDLLIQAQEGIVSLNDIYVEVEECWEKYEVLHFENLEVFFYPELCIIMEKESPQKISVKPYEEKINFNKVIINKKTILKKWPAELLREQEAKKIYFKYSKKNNNYNGSTVVCVRPKEKQIGYMTKGEKFVKFLSVRGNNAVEESRLSPSFYEDIWMKEDRNNICSVRVPLGYHFDGHTKTKLDILLEIGHAPVELKSKKLFINLLELLNKGYVSKKNGVIQLTELGKEAIENGTCTQIGKVKLIKKNDKITKECLKEMKIDVNKLDSDEKKRIFQYYSDCDKIRGNINSYDIAWLEDPNQGHWELWDGNLSKDTIELSKDSKVYARNPESDIRNDCIVGIDFGTKSTVVVCQNETGKIKPMPIGNGNIRKELEKRDFENPTVMQFININRFLKDYRAREGRPYTRWKDLIVSHSANESMQDTGVRSDEFYSYLYDLKQWSGEGKKTINIRDKTGHDILLSTYMDISTKEDIDPIEIYAYYIGLYINNMNNGIYMTYLLSFPVTYEKSIRNAILSSFERGLKKSLPESILNNEEVMSKFTVEAGASEPAAYAICALEEYGFEPTKNEKVFYGIFDFGGGTSDFDFGLWTMSDDEELFDYCIEHFGTQGDRYLGGENLLQLIAFEAFKENISLCRKEGIPFAKPIEMMDYPSELSGYVNDSQEARMNQKLMMEKLRPFWERSDDLGNELIKIEEFNEFQIGLFNVEGVLKSNLPFEIDVQKLDYILHNRIEKGVRQFFEALKDTFTDKLIRKTASVELINIFLAGNSSKSPILQEIFKEKIEEWNSSMEENKEHFVLFPALGTEAAKKIQEEKGIKHYDSLESPTGKTGVAWGLIKGREGGRIEVKEEISFEDEAKFAYYLGIQKGKCFYPKINRDAEYGKWMRFLPAKRRMNEILYTNLPEAAGGKLLCIEEGVLRKRIEIPTTALAEGKNIFIRLISTNSIEYAIGDDNGEIDETTIKVELF